MKKYTQEEFDAIPRDEQGVKQCPTGDYTAITRFGEGCRFGPKTISWKCTRWYRLVPAPSERWSTF